MRGLNTPGHRYRDGHVKVWPSRGSAGLEAVNLVRVRDYLLGVAEVPSSWPRAALEAQVLAARSYALSKLATGVRSGCRCHVDDGGGPYYDQTFVGTAKVTGTAGNRWAAAVAATESSSTTGLAVLYAGEPITAFYSSSTGGSTQSNQDVWNPKVVLPWAQSVDDHWSLEPAVKNPYASWTRARTQAEVAAVFGLPDVVSVDLSNRTAGNALAKVTATSSKGATATVSGSSFASRLALPSRWVRAATAVRT
jgi:SpoIID/LytB domain protein